MQFIRNGLQGFQLALQGIFFLSQHRSLWKWAVLPALVNFVVFAIAFTIFLTYFDEMYTIVTRPLALESPSAWYAWLWVGPLRLVTWIIGGMIFAIALVVGYLVFLLLGTALAAPFLEVLSLRVEEILTGQSSKTPATLGHFLRSVVASLVVELKKIGFFLAVHLLLFLLGLIPILAPFTILAATIFTMLFLPIEYTSFSMDRRQYVFAQRRQFVWRHRWLALGFGAAASLTLLIPFLNFICLPALVVGGTLLFLHTDETERGTQNAEHAL